MEKYRIVQVSIFDKLEGRGRTSLLPLAEAIVIVPTLEDGAEFGLHELEPWIPNPRAKHNIVTDLGPILWPPVPTTIFLYNQSAGRIK